jgi:thiol-disulfide isomerase/thioredoxin
MTLGFAVIGGVFLNNRQALPVSIGEPITYTENISLTELPTIIDTNVGETEVIPESNSGLQADSTDNPIAQQISNNRVTLTVVSTDQADEIIPPMSLNYDPANAITVPTWDLEIPNPQMPPVTVFLAGATGCSSCAIEAQALQQIAHDLENPNLQIIVVDIYPYGGAEGLAWFAGVMDATDLTWAMDQNNNFMNTYRVALDSTLIMDSTGTILYRDDVITSPEVLREQIERALNQST